MVKRAKCGRDIELEYSFDRLSAEKISQVYRLLVPEKIWEMGDTKESLRHEGAESVADEAGSDLHARIIR